MSFSITIPLCSPAEFAKKAKDYRDEITDAFASSDENGEYSAQYKSDTADLAIKQAIALVKAVADGAKEGSVTCYLSGNHPTSQSKQRSIAISVNFLPVS